MSGSVLDLFWAWALSVLVEEILHDPESDLRVVLKVAVKKEPWGQYTWLKEILTTNGSLPSGHFSGQLFWTVAIWPRNCSISGALDSLAAGRGQETVILYKPYVYNIFAYSLVIHQEVDAAEVPLSTVLYSTVCTRFGLLVVQDLEFVLGIADAEFSLGSASTLLHEGDVGASDQGCRRRLAFRA